MLLILPTTRTWRNRFVALSVPSTRLCSLQNHPQNLLLDLQVRPAKHTDDASSGRLHSDDQVRPQNHQWEKLVVCVKNSYSLFSRIPPQSLPDSILCLSLYLGLTEFCYAHLTCVRTLLCFSETMYLQNQ